MCRNNKSHIINCAIYRAIARSIADEKSATKALERAAAEELIRREACESAGVGTLQKDVMWKKGVSNTDARRSPQGIADPDRESKIRAAINARFRTRRAGGTIFVSTPSRKRVEFGCFIVRYGGSEAILLDRVEKEENYGISAYVLSRTQFDTAAESTKLTEWCDRITHHQSNLFILAALKSGKAVDYRERRKPRSL